MEQDFSAARLFLFTLFVDPSEEEEGEKEEEEDFQRETKE